MGIILPFIVISLISCNSSSEPRAPIQMRFTVDSSMVALPVVGSTSSVQFSVQPPKEYSPVDSTTLKTIIERVNATNVNDSVKIIPVIMSVSTTTGSIMMVSEVNFPFVSDDADSVVSVRRRVAQYKKFLYKKYDSTTIKTTSFMKDGGMVEQFLITDSSNINFRLLYLATPKSFVQQDFIIPQKAYNEYTARSLESSIGSFIFLTHSSKR